MKTVIRTIIVCVTLNLMTAGFALAQDVADEETHKALDMQAKEASFARREAEIAAKVAEKEEEAARKQIEAAAKKMQAAEEQMRTAKKKMQAQQSLLEDVQKLVEIDIPKIEVAIPRVSIPAWQHSGGGAVLVIPAAELNVEDLATITEDMTVMSRIFDNKLSQAHLTTGRGSWFGGFDPFSGRNSGAIEAIYLEGYGALFLMKVNVLLSPPPEAIEEKETEEEDTDPLWTETKQEIYAPEKLSRRQMGRSEEKQKYDTKKVENLKTSLVKTLKHAANIRTLKPDESVILVVTGSGESAGGITAVATTKIVGHEDHNTRIVEELAPRGSSPTMLVIRAKKSDIDGFAKADLDFDQFRKRTQILTCPYLGGGARRGDLFGDYSRSRSGRSRR